MHQFEIKENNVHDSFNLLPLHCNAMLSELHACGREIANPWLIGFGNEKGTFPVTIRQVQSILVVISDSIASQQLALGDRPFALLPVK